MVLSDIIYYMSLVFRVAEAKMDKLADELETSLRLDGKIYEDVTLRNGFGLGLTTNLKRELREDGSRGPVTINANFSEFFGSVRNEIYVEENGAVVPENMYQCSPPGLLRRAKLLTRLVIGRPDHIFAELEFNGAFDGLDED